MGADSGRVRACVAPDAPVREAYSRLLTFQGRRLQSMTSERDAGPRPTPGGPGFARVTRAFDEDARTQSATRTVTAPDSST